MTAHRTRNSFDGFSSEQPVIFFRRAAVVSRRQDRQAIRPAPSIEQPTKFEFVINVKNRQPDQPDDSANALAIADRVIKLTMRRCYDCIEFSIGEIPVRFACRVQFDLK
jgi:hypothetical protein